jgi:hypothetical protein
MAFRKFSRGVLLKLDHGLQVAGPSGGLNLDQEEEQNSMDFW